MHRITTFELAVLVAICFVPYALLLINWIWTKHMRARVIRFNTHLRYKIAARELSKRKAGKSEWFSGAFERARKDIVKQVRNNLKNKEYELPKCSDCDAWMCTDDKRKKKPPGTLRFGHCARMVINVDEDFGCTRFVKK